MSARALRADAHELLHELEATAPGALPEGYRPFDFFGIGLRLGLVIAAERPDYAAPLLLELDAWLEATELANQREADRSLLDSLPPVAP